MKKTIILLTMLIVAVNMPVSQTAISGSWVIPDYWDVFRLDFPGPIKDNLNYNPNGGYSVPNSCAAFSNSGNLLFYTLGHQLYDANHDLIGPFFNFDPPFSSWVLNPEIEIIRKPGSFGQFYLIFSVGLDVAETEVGHLHYCLINVDPQTLDITLNSSVLIESTGRRTGIAVTNESNGVRELWFVAHNTGVSRLLITTDGLSLEYEEIINRFDPAFQSFYYFNCYNLELFEAHNGDIRLAWITRSSHQSGGTSGYQKILYTVYNDGNILTKQVFSFSNLSRMNGIEFSHVNGNIMYFSNSHASLGGIYELDIPTGTSALLNNSGSYSKTFIQTAPDGHIYAVNNTGTMLGRILMPAGTFQGQILSFSPSTLYVEDGSNYFILPEEHKVFDPLILQTVTQNVTCPGDANGSATAVVNGGTEPYYYIWKNPFGMIILEGEGQQYNHIENLVAGTYECCVTDLYQNTICLSFEILVNPLLFTHPGEFFEVSNTQTITANYAFEKGIIVKNLAKLTVSESTFQFAKGAKVIVEPGSELIIDNSVFTHLQDCDDMWQGIEVWGNKLRSQYFENNEYFQGKIVLKDSAVIENAITGVRLGKPGTSSFNGGIILANDAIFRNNAKSVHFLEYNNYYPNDNNKPADNISYFKYCDFEITQEYIGGETFYKHADLARVKGIKFIACDFSTTPPGIWVYPTNHAIGSYSSGFSAMAICTQPTNPCREFDRCTFTGFFAGVYATNDWQNNNTFYINRADFNNNVYGVLALGVNNATVLNSNFYIGYNEPESDPCDGEGKSASGYGIHMTGCTGFAIEENEFYKASGAPNGYYTGILCKDGKSFHDIIYGNTFNGLSYGNFAEGNNRYSSGDQYGLEYQCNTNTGNNRDFIVTGNDPNKPPQIRGYQGSMSKEAGNTFSTGVQLPDGHFKNTGTQVINYCYNTNPPVYYTPFYVMPIPNAGVNTCPSNYGGGSGGSTRDVVLTADEIQEAEMEFATNLADFNNVKALFDNLKDGGNTQALKTEVETAWPSDMWTLRDELLGKSPHLSQEVLMAAADKTDVLPESILFEILSANPDELRKEELISHLENKDQPLPAYMISILRQLAGGITYKTILLQDMAGYHAGKTQAAYMLIRSCLNDTVSDNAYLRTWLNNLDNLNADLQIVASYLAEDNYTAAQTMLDLIPATRGLEGNELAKYNDYKTLMQMQMAWQQQGRSIFELDSLEVEVLVNFAENTGGKAALMAKGILEYAYGHHYCNCLPVDDPAAWKSTAMMPGSDVDNGLSIQAVPNPASTWVAFNITLPVHINEAVLNITDVHGRSITSFVITAKQGQQVWDIRDMKKGVYLYNIKAGVISKNGKLIIQ